jgi:acyl-CoA synthetase (AMP-forming)/AMP-acid ligase II
MLAFARTMVDWLRFTPDDVGCTLSPFHLAGGLRATLLIPMLGGGSVVCLPEADTDGFFRALDEFRPTYLSAGFAVHRAILRRAGDFREEIARSRLRFLRTTAGRLEPDEIDRLEAIFRAPVVVGLGSTEACGIAHDPLPPRPRKRGAVGLATRNEVAVIDASGRFGAQGSVGEIAVRGPLVFDGYLDDPELTARSFAGDWLRTGDLGWIDEDGYVFLSGRINEMINRGGEKISPVEIDGALESLAGVGEAAAFGVPHPTLGEEVVAAVVREAGSTIGEADIIDHVGRRLGSRQAPRRIHFMDRLPRTDSGKVRRNVLAQMFGLDPRRGGSDDAAPAIAGAAPIEATLMRLWSDSLRGRAVGRDDNYFLVGGDSLSGLRLLGHVKAIFGIELPVRALFGDASTVAGMARAIEQVQAAASPAGSGLADPAPARATGGSVPVPRER